MLVLKFLTYVLINLFKWIKHKSEPFVYFVQRAAAAAGEAWTGFGFAASVFKVVWRFFLSSSWSSRLDGDFWTHFYFHTGSLPELLYSNTQETASRLHGSELHIKWHRRSCVHLYWWVCRVFAVMFFWHLSVVLNTRVSTLLFLYTVMLLTCCQLFQLFVFTATCSSSLFFFLSVYICSYILLWTIKIIIYGFNLFTVLCKRF